MVGADQAGLDRNDLVDIGLGILVELSGGDPTGILDRASCEATAW